LYSETTTRKIFPISVKKLEWMFASGKSVNDYLQDKKKFVKTSSCRKCKMKLIWGERGYQFDHKDNNNANNSQKNCYLVCANCHSKATKIEKRAIKGIFGITTGYQTIKRKVSYKKPKTTPKKSKSVAVKAKKKPIAKKTIRKTRVKKPRNGAFFTLGDLL
jgi:hypothetical protein